MRTHSRTICLALSGAVSLLSLGCSLGPNPRKDLRARVEARLKEHPFFELVSIRKYVKEVKENNNKEYGFQIEYRATKPCLFDAMNAPGPNAVTLDLCSNKQGFMSYKINPGEKVVEVASLSYSNDKLAQVEFRSIHSLFPGSCGELEE